MILDSSPLRAVALRVLLVHCAWEKTDGSPRLSSGGDPSTGRRTLARNRDCQCTTVTVTNTVTVGCAIQVTEFWRTNTVTALARVSPSKGLDPMPYK